MYPNKSTQDIRRILIDPPFDVPEKERKVVEKRNRRSRNGPAVAQPGGPDGTCAIRKTV